MKRFLTILMIIVLLVGCSPIREQAQLIGFKDGRSLLVIDEGKRDTISWGQRHTGKIGTRYWVYWGCHNKITRIKDFK